MCFYLKQRIKRKLKYTCAHKITKKRDLDRWDIANVRYPIADLIGVKTALKMTLKGKINFLFSA